ncbi:MAG: phosphatase PAP2 family protein [Treponema sp.]|nr:phosphatase PAP2 family protein [Treponema sp.]
MKKTSYINKLRGAVAAVFMLTFCPGIYAQSLEYVQPFSLNPVKDGIELGLGTALSGSALLYNDILHLKQNDFKASDLKKSDISVMDQLFMRPYSKPLHIVGTGTMGLALLTPAVFALMPSSEWLTIGTMYVETLLFANGIKEWAKFFAYRARPYMYFDDYPENKVEDGDWNCSFPSGHTTLAFAGAAFTTVVYCQCFPESKWKYAVAGGAFGIAALTGALRMASGNHFFTDVMAGALIGTVCGFAVPFLHIKRQNVNAAVTPEGLTFVYKF